MLKKIIVNQRVVPVPVPIKTLDEACAWIDEILVPAGETVTSAMLDNKDILDLWASQKVSSGIRLYGESRLEVRIESPEDLALQTLDAVHSLGGAILKNIKVLAVNLWQSRHTEEQPELQALRDDVQLMVELLDRMNDMDLGRRIDLTRTSQLKERMQKIDICLEASSSIGDWRGSAQILLRDTGTAIGLETTLKELLEESESCHLKMLASRGSPAGKLNLVERG